MTTTGQREAGRELAEQLGPSISPPTELSTSMSTTNPRRRAPAKPIPSGEMWPLSFLHSRCGYGARARAAAIKAGLPVYRWQKRAWISTDDLIDLLRRHNEPQEP